MHHFLKYRVSCHLKYCEFLVLVLVWFSFGVTTGCAQAYSSGFEEPYGVMGSEYRLVAGKANALPAVLFLQSQNSEYFLKRILHWNASLLNSSLIFFSAEKIKPYSVIFLKCCLVWNFIFTFIYDLLLLWTNIWGRRVCGPLALMLRARLCAQRSLLIMVGKPDAALGLSWGQLCTSSRALKSSLYYLCSPWDKFQKETDLKLQDV